MLEIVLLILKTAGVIFVSVLGILIVLTVVVLFVPVRYRGDIFVSDKADGGKKAAAVRLKAAWFFRFARVYLTWEDTLRIRFKLLFFTLADTAKEQGGKRKKKERRRKEKEEAGAENRGAGEKEQSAGNRGAEGEEQSAGNGGDGQEESAGPVQESVSVEREKREEIPCGGEDAPGIEEKEHTADRKKTIKYRFSNIMQTIRNFCDKLKEIKKKKDKAGELWASKHVINSRNLLGKQLRYLLRHTKPKNISGYFRFGFDDPSVTGYAMAVYGILYPIWSPKLSVEPDFEKQALDCHVLIKGKIRVWHFVRAALRMILSGDVRRVIKDVKEF